jgi:phosphate ABC transporter permease protein PstC
VSTLSESELALESRLESPVAHPHGSGTRATALFGGRRNRVSERVAAALLATCAVFSGLVVIFVVIFVFREAMPLFVRQGWYFLSHIGWDGQLDDAWTDTSALFGAAELIAATALTTLGAITASVILGLGCAVFLAEVAPAWLRKPVEIVIQLLAGIPSVVFGLVGLMVVVPLLTLWIPADSFEVVTDIPLDGASLAAAIIVLTFMILPFFTAVAVDSLRSVPRPYFDGSLALGLTKWRTISKVQVPAAVPGLLAGAVLASGRAIGEAIAISMVSGSIAFIPTLKYGLQYFPFMPVRTLASTLVENGGETMSVPNILVALFGLAALLLIWSLLLSLTARLLIGWYSSRTAVSTGRSL